MDESQHVKLRPYRYPSIQKDEIERMVEEMKAVRVIRDSTSSFASPVVLVKKKDGSWRLCIDYRRLNKLTVKDKFPIPLVEELLDELSGAFFFPNWTCDLVIIRSEWLKRIFTRLHFVPITDTMNFW